MAPTAQAATNGSCKGGAIDNSMVLDSGISANSRSASTRSCSFSTLRVTTPPACEICRKKTRLPGGPSAPAASRFTESNSKLSEGTALLSLRLP